METFWIFSSREIKNGAIPRIALFSLWFKRMDPSFISCKNLGEKRLSLSVKTYQQLKRNGFPLSFVFKYKAPTNPSVCTPKNIHILNDVTNTSFAHWKTVCWLLGCDVSILVNNGISMLQHFRTDSYDRTAWVKQLFSFALPVSEAITLFPQWPTVLLPTAALLQALERCWRSISHWWFDSNKELYHSVVHNDHHRSGCCEVVQQWCYLSEIFMTSYINTRNFKSVSSKISSS